MGVSCLSLSSRAVGKEYFRTGTAESQGWRPAFVRPYAGACMFLPPCPLTDIKRAHPAYPFCSFFIPVSHRKGTGGQIPRPIPAKCTGKKGNSGKSEKPPYFLHLRAQAGNAQLRFLSHRQEWNWKWNQEESRKIKAPGIFFIYLQYIFIH